MKKKHNLIKNLFLTFVLAGSMAVLSGCTSLSYVGDDFDSKNSATVQTNELFTFSTYNKTSSEENIDMKVGVSKTPLPDALVVYVNIKNNTAADYIFYLKDMEIKVLNEKLTPIAPSSYLEAYQSYETGTYAGLSNIAPTLGAFADIQNSYHNVNNVNTAASKNNSHNAVTSQIGSVVGGISQHTITSASVIKSGASEFFYVFLKDPTQLPIEISYKDLVWSFGTAEKKNGAEKK
ncbi:MAG: hypothetical protein OSJ27_06130 [Candidatus Gastranaerophilales bacterium]|nr:hypothetical protein [Candidatus Gastranaerophilales bacterium]